MKNYRSVSEWPIHPNWLSIRKGVSEKETNPNTEGLFQPDYLRGFIADASDDEAIQSPLALFQVVPEYYEYEDSNRRVEKIDKSSIKNNYIKDILRNNQIIRIEPGYLYQNIECCTLFKKCQDENGLSCKNKCFDLDSRIALFYHQSLAAIHFTRENKKYIYVLENIINKFNQSIIDKNDNYFVKLTRFVEILNGYKYSSVYLKFRCVYSQLDKYIFPVIHSGKVIAVVMVSGRPHSDLNKKDMFENYRNNSEEGKQLEDSINNIPISFYKEKSLDEKCLHAILNSIITLELRINNVVMSIAQRYVSDKLKKIEKDYRSTIHKQKYNACANDLSLLLDNTLFSVLQAFNESGFLRIYARKSDIEMFESSYIEFTLIGNATFGTQSVLSNKYSSLKFNSTLFLQENKVDKLSEYILGDVPIHPNDIFRMETQFNAKTGYVIWKRYEGWNNDYPEQYYLYAQSLKGIYSSLLEPYFVLKSLESEENLEKIMRFIAHESAQIIPSVIDSINTNETKQIIKGNFFQKQIFNINIPSYKAIDATRRLLLLERTFIVSRMLLKDISAKFEWHDLIGIINATDSLFSQRAKEQNEQRLIIDSELKLSYYDLFTDYGFMSHILFNLVDNAIKYGFRGSNVVIKILSQNNESSLVYDEKQISELQLSIISYGNEIKEKEKIFELYYRSETSIITEGMGIGLFLVQKLCYAMGYKIQCKPSICISSINLPYYLYYKKEKSNYANENLSTEIISSLNSIVEKSRLEEVVNSKIKRWRISGLELSNNLFMPVYKNEFIITIPIKTNLLKKR